MFKSYKLDTESNYLNNESNEAIENISMPFNDFNETNLSDISISDINTSKISETDNTFDLTGNILKDLSFSKTFKSAKINNENLKEKVRDYKALLNDLNIAQIKRYRTKLILQTLEEIVNDNFSTLPLNLRNKCSFKLRCCSLMHTLRNSEVVKMINVCPKKVCLSAEEIKLINQTLQDTLEKKCLKLKNESELITGILGKQWNNLILPGSILTEDKAKIINLTDELSEIIDLNVKEVNKFLLLTNEIRDIRVSKYQEMYKDEVECLENKIKLLALNMKNLNFMIENNIIQSSDNISKAVDILHKELNASLENVEYSTQKLKIKKEEYDKLSGTKFDDILDEYIKLRENFRRKNWALRKINPL